MVQCISDVVPLNKQTVHSDTSIIRYEGGAYTLREFKILQGANNSPSTKDDK